MRKLVLIIVMMAAWMGASAQNCTAIVLPKFHYDTAWMALCPVDKLQWYCLESQAAFYESDTVPTGAAVYSITEVKEIDGDSYLPSNFVVDLNTLSLYAYNFEYFYSYFPTDWQKTICFTTPSSTHPYLVLRSVYDKGVLLRRMAQEAGL